MKSEVASELCLPLLTLADVFLVSPIHMCGVHGFTVALGEIPPKVQSWRPGPVQTTSLYVYMRMYSRIRATSRTSRTVQVDIAKYALRAGFHLVQV